MPVVIVDIDGTVALHHNPDGSQRRGHYEYGRVSEDLPNQPIIELTCLFRAFKYEVVFLSGREDSCLEQTITWLRKYVLGNVSVVAPDPEIYMRASGDHREDNIIKRELYEAHVLPREVAFVLEDRNQMVEMWRGLGLTCLQVAPGNF